MFGTSVDSSAAEMTVEIAIKDSVDSLPPKRSFRFDVLGKV